MLILYLGEDFCKSELGQINPEIEAKQKFPELRKHNKKQTKQQYFFIHSVNVCLYCIRYHELLDISEIDRITQKSENPSIYLMVATVKCSQTALNISRFEKNRKRFFQKVHIHPNRVSLFTQTFYYKKTLWKTLKK